MGVQKKTELGVDFAPRDDILAASIRCADAAVSPTIVHTVVHILGAQLVKSSKPQVLNLISRISAYAADGALRRAVYRVLCESRLLHDGFEPTSNRFDARGPTGM